MQVKLSFTTKTILILLAMVLTVTVVISTMLIRESESNITFQQQEEQVSNQRRLQLFSDVLHSRMVMWVDTFSQAELKNHQDLSKLALALKNTQEYLMLNFQVESLFLFDEYGVVGDRQAEPPVFVQRLVKSTQTTLESKTLVTCELICRFYLSVPIMT